mmetsp:Transcript_5017/g.10864  ORF Transcript_5017/g.10864 Transcript_5017/m.10864 type:complete len:203 (-) Transcript_5017:331-939(-)
MHATALGTAAGLLTMLPYLVRAMQNRPHLFHTSLCTPFTLLLGLLALLAACCCAAAGHCCRLAGAGLLHTQDPGERDKGDTSQHVVEGPDDGLVDPERRDGHHLDQDQVSGSEHLVPQVAGQAHVQAPGARVVDDVGGLVLQLEVGVELLPQQQQSIGKTGTQDTGSKANTGKHHGLVAKVEQTLAQGEGAGLKHVAAGSPP